MFLFMLDRYLSERRGIDQQILNHRRNGRTRSRPSSKAKIAKTPSLGDGNARKMLVRLGQYTQTSADFMKSILLGCCGLFLCSIALAQDTYPGGLVYGPKAAFSVAAPEGWVLDNQAGVEQGLPCVLYPKGSSWSDAKAIIYAKIASTQYESAEAFVATAIKEMQDVRGTPKQKVESGKTSSGQAFFINEYRPTKSYSQWERVAYVQLPKAVAYVVFSARDEASFRKYSPALTAVLKSFAYLELKFEKEQH